MMDCFNVPTKHRIDRIICVGHLPVPAHQRRPCTLAAWGLCRLGTLSAINRIGHIQVMTSNQLVKPILSVIVNALTLSCPALSAVVTNCCNQQASTTLNEVNNPGMTSGAR